MKKTAINSTLGGKKHEGNIKKGSIRISRTLNTENRLKLYRSKGLSKQATQEPTAPARIQPDRRWFGNTRVINQQKLERFREELSKDKNDPTAILIKRSKLPLGLLQTKDLPGKIVNKLSYSEVFGPKKQRKRVKLSVDSLDEFALQAKEREESYNEFNDKSKSILEDELEILDTSESIFSKGTSKRIWGELYKVIDSSDIIIQVLDSRDPMGTRCLRLENHIKTNTCKHLILLLNKCDLVPTWVTKHWIKLLSVEFPTIAFHASINKPFGKHTLLDLLRQYSRLMKDRKHVSVGFIGYPNVGKSSVINTLCGTKSCKAAPLPGETRVWQYVSLTKRVHMIDCPGIVPPDEISDVSKVLKGVVRIERVNDPENYIFPMLELVKKEDLVSIYSISDDWTKYSGEEMAQEFLETVAKKSGKMLPGGIPDCKIAARMVLNDFQRGRISYFVSPPHDPSNSNDISGVSQDS